MTWLQIILMALAVFRLTHLMIYDTITEKIRLLFLEEKNATNGAGEASWYYEPKGRGIQRFIGGLLNCHWCLSVWISIFMITGYMVWPIVFTIMIYIFAVAAIAVIIEEFVLKFF